MNMSFGGSDNEQAFRLGGFEIGSYIAARVDDDRFAALLAADEVRSMGKRLVVKVFE
jgi:hypothetical protein